MQCGFGQSSFQANVNPLIFPAGAPVLLTSAAGPRHDELVIEDEDEKYHSNLDLTRSNPKGPSTQYLRFVVPKNHPFRCF